MARSTLCSLFYLLLSSSRLLVSPVAAFNLARPVPQRLDQRQTFEGGWAIGLPGTTCPSEAPEVCTSSNIANPGCCPSGTTCFGLSSLYCCPTETDCAKIVEEFPRCANSSWTLYQLSESSGTYFCCPPGQFGVLPIQNYGGLCQPNDVEVASSRIATQIGGPSATDVVETTVKTTARTTRTVTSVVTGTDGAVSTVTELSAGQVILTSTGSVSEASSAATNGQGDNETSSSSSKSLGAGPIAGIVIGALAVLALFILAFLFYRYIKTKKHSGVGFVPQEQAPHYSAVPPQDNHPDMQDYRMASKSPATIASGLHSGDAQGVGNVSPLHSGYGQRPVEAPVPQRWEGRAEIGSSG